jgi:alkaline phosphatase D
MLQRTTWWMRGLAVVGWGVLATPGLAGAADQDEAPHLVLGPMTGHTTDTSVTLWAATSAPAPIAVLLKSPEGEVVKAEGRTSAVVDGGGSNRVVTGTVTVRGLRPRTRYSVQVLVADETQPQNFSLLTAPAADQHEHLRIGLASGANTALDRQQWVWQTVAEAKPDVMLFLGDTPIFQKGTALHEPDDWDEVPRMATRHLELRGLKPLQSLLRGAACYATWGSHDYGASDSDSSFALKGDALRLFKAMWTNPAYGSGGSEGLWCTFRRGDVQVLLLDDRYCRDSDDVPRDKRRMLGKVQTDWLVHELTTSTATIKVVALGCQFLGDQAAFPGYAQFPAERAQILEALAAKRVDGVLFVSGDRSFAELQKLDREGAYQLYDLGTSPVAGRIDAAGYRTPNALRAAGYSGGANFGILDIDTAAVPPAVVFRVSDSKGGIGFTKTVLVSDLKYK